MNVAKEAGIYYERRSLAAAEYLDTFLFLFLLSALTSCSICACSLQMKHTSIALPVHQHCGAATGQKA